MHTHIFISYGHDDCTDKVKVIMKSLDARDEYQIWWDGDLKASADWVRQLEDQLDRLISNKPDSCFIYIVTHYSASDTRYNFCINEILRVLQGSVRILPIRLDTTPLPLPIGSIQWFDLTQCEIDVNSKDFQSRLEDLFHLIDSKEPVKIDGKQGALHNLLKPCLFTLDIDKHLHNYLPRQWMLNATVDWLDNREERILLVLGGPGTGKTAFSLWLSTRKLPDRIHAWHLCQYNDEATRSLLTCVKSLTWYLATRLPDFYNSLDLSRIEALAQDGENHAGTMFKELILGKLKETHVTGEKVVVLIDALDEASSNGINKVAEVLSQYVADMPGWLRFIITSRDDRSVTLPLKDISYVLDLDSQSNGENCLSDIRSYVTDNLDKGIIEQNTGIVETIANQSGNVFLYAKLMCQAINKRELVDLNRLPRGLNHFYDNHMRRYFGSNGVDDFRSCALPIIHIMLASFQPIKRKYIFKRIHKREGWCLNQTVFQSVLNQFGPLLKDNAEYVLPFHKSFCDWLTDPANSSFYASREDGIEVMCDWGTEVLSDEFAEEELSKHFFTYQPQYLIESGNHKELLTLFSDNSFWERRREIIGVDLMIQRMFIELSLMHETVRKRLFKEPGFKRVLYDCGPDLFDKGLFLQLKRIGFTIDLPNCKNDMDRMTALRYCYINGEYTVISSNLDLFSQPYDDKSLDPAARNLLGLATKKCGMLDTSAAFFKQALQLSSEQPSQSTNVIYYHLNLSRLLTILCRFDEGRKELETAFELFNSQGWHRETDSSEDDFALRQIELAARYVTLETELFSERYQVDVCEKELAWANELYSSEMRIDRYYPRHLQSVILFLLREHRFSEIKPVFEELDKNQSGAIYDARSPYYLSLYLYAIGEKKAGYQTACNQLLKLKENTTMKIEKTELFALIDFMESQDHFEEVSEELKPWYRHTISIIKQIVG